MIVALAIVGFSSTCGRAATLPAQTVTTPKAVLWEPNNGGTAAAFLGDFQSTFALPNTKWPKGAQGTKYLMLRSITVARQGRAWVQDTLAPFMAAEHLQLVLDTTASTGWSCVAGKNITYSHELKALEWAEAAGITVAYLNFQDTLSNVSVCSPYTMQQRSSDVITIAHKYRQDLVAAGLVLPKFMMTDSDLRFAPKGIATYWGSDASCTPAATQEKYTGCLTVYDLVNTFLYYAGAASPVVKVTDWKIDIGAENICHVMLPGGSTQACAALSPAATVTDDIFTTFTNFLYAKGIVPWLDISVNQAATYSDVITRGQATATWLTGLSGHAVRSAALVLFAPLTGGGADMPAYLEENTDPAETYLLKAITQTIAAWTPH